MTDAAALPDPADDDAPEGGEQVVDELIAAEMGERIAEAIRAVRRQQEEWFRAHHPEEGLRDRKRRQTRQLISDVATTLFITRGFDDVKVSEIADRVGVSEKTVYNYFPTKESMILDDADEMVEQVAGALRDREPGETLTAAVVRALKVDVERLDAAPEILAQFVPAFVELFERTPALRAAMLELNDRIARVATEELALTADLDPRDPEPVAAGRALVGLMEVGMESRVRHIENGLRGPQLRDAVVADVERGARLLETGLWSFNLPRSERARSQVREATRAAEEARVQVLKAMREARAAWDQLRDVHRQSGAETRKTIDELREQARRAGREGREEARRATALAREAHRHEMQQALHAMRDEMMRSDPRRSRERPDQ